MKKSIVVMATFVFAFSVGLGISLVSHGEAQALWCYYYSSGYNFTSIPCSCPSGPDGVIVEHWVGYNQDWTYCGYYTYCSTCPPKSSKYPIPYEQPPDGGE
ncbi:MAG: hypothetical protein R3F48_12475 [Candidatus Zixiibacteriota bacterium]